MRNTTEAAPPVSRSVSQYTPKKPLVALYARVSTDDQNCEMQLHELRDMAERRGWTVFHEYVDQGHSGAKTSRPALDEMLKAMHRGRFGILAVWRFDRLARSLSQLLNILEECRKNRMELVSLSDNLDLSGANGRLLFAVIGAFAEFERHLICERVRSGMESARRRGKQIGRPLNSVVDIEVAERMLADGRGLREVARELGVPVTTLSRRLGRK